MGIEPPMHAGSLKVASSALSDMPLSKLRCFYKKRTVLVTIFGNKQMYVKPIIVFAGKGTRITTAERAAWDKDVHVCFQVRRCSCRGVAYIWG